MLSPICRENHSKIPLKINLAFKNKEKVQNAYRHWCNYFGFVRMSSSPANSCLLFLSPTQVVPHTPFNLWPLWQYDIYVYDPCLGLPPSPYHHNSTPCLPCSPLGGGRLSSIRSGSLLLVLCLWPWRHSQKNKTSFEDISVLSFAGLTVTRTVALCLWLITPTSTYSALLMI